LGQNSIAAFLSEETTAAQPSADGEQDVIRKDIMPILGLQVSSASYPFMSKEHMDKIRHDIASALPSDRDVLKLVIPVGSPDVPVLIITQGLSNLQANRSAILGSSHRC